MDKPPHAYESAGSVPLAKPQSTNEAAILNEFCDTQAISGNESAPSVPSDSRLLERGPVVTNGELVGRYRIGRELGCGAFGFVHLAFDEALRRDVAIKTPNRKYLGSDEVVDVFLREAQVLASVDHPNVVPVYDVGLYDINCDERGLWAEIPKGSVTGDCGLRHAGRIGYVVSKYMVGGDLVKRRAEFEGDFKKIAQLIASLAKALGHLHRMGFVHRDVKPANILFDATGTPYLADFGLAIHEIDQPFHAGELAGTYAYMSPEQLRGQTEWIDGRTDIWALGVLLYELLTNRSPFQGKFGGFQREVEERDPKPPRQINPLIPASMDRACLTALRKAPADRFSSAIDFADLLECGRVDYFGTPMRRKPEVAFVVNEIRRIPRGPMVQDSLALRRLMECFCEMFPSYPEARNLLEEAATIRQQADPDATVVKPYHVTGEAGPVAGFWADVFREARKHGPRMVAALLLAVPREEILRVRESIVRDYDSVLTELRMGIA